MLRDNLRIVATNRKAFENVKYGFCCNHDIREKFEEEYSAIYQKYMRRVERFREMSMHPTVFFRCIRNQEEIEYINRHWQYAENLVKSRNENSRIIYVFCSSLKGLTQDLEPPERKESISGGREIWKDVGGLSFEERCADRGDCRQQA